MIVKNEAHIIAGTLAHLCEHFTFSYWVISDTGSTDGTQDIIRKFFADRSIPGELNEEAWRDFGYNRTVALEQAYNKSDYLLVWDADDSIVGKIPLPKKLTADSYSLSFGSYFRPQLVNNRKRWKYVGVLHEYITSIDPTSPAVRVIGDYYCVSGRAGARNRDPEKYLKDAQVLERALVEDPTNSRNAFYCANSYRDANKPEKAIEFYKRTLTMNGWSEEKYLSAVRIFEHMRSLGKETEGIGYLAEAHAHSPNRVEDITQLVRYFCAKGQHEMAMFYYSLVSKHFERNYTERGIYSEHLFLNLADYQFYLPYYVIIAALQTKQFDTAYTMYKIILHHKCTDVDNWYYGNLFFNLKFLTSFKPDMAVLQSMLDYFQQLRTKRGLVLKDDQAEGIEKHLELFRPVLTAPVKSLPKKIPNPKPTVMFTMTSCKRLDLFTQTMNSILRTWKDIDSVDYFFCVDDNSSEADRKQMRKLYPFFNYYMKGANERGHRESMNIIWNRLNELKPTYWIHMEDDWLFYQSDDYVAKSIAFLKKYKGESIHQILYNRNYAETFRDWGLQGGKSLSADYVLHEKSDTVVGRNCAYWPHYSFRPSMILTETILKLGNYDSANTFFERDYADRWYSAGYRSAFFNRVASRHIGKLTSDKTGTNAYKLNDVGQFETTMQSQSQPIQETPTPSSFVVNLKRRPDRRDAVIAEFNKHDVKDYAFVDAVDGKELVPTPELATMFANNDFGNRRGVIGCALSHINLWKQLLNDPKHEYYTIFEDDITLVDGYVEKYAAVLKEPQTYDLLFLGYHSIRNASRIQGNGKVIKLDHSLYIGGTYGYIVTKQGAKRLLDFIGTYGVRHGIDYQMKITPQIDIRVVQPHIVLSEWVQDATNTVDSDIQRERDALNLALPAVNMDDWTFHSGVDSMGHDITFVGRKSAQELVMIANQTPNCVAFNTLGFLKSVVNMPLVHSQYFGASDGVYIRKNRPIRVKMLCNWCSSEQLCKEWNKMTKGNYQWNNIQMTWLDDGIDYYVIINKPPAGAYFDPKKTIVFQMEPWCGEDWQTWGVKTWGEWARPDPAKFLHVQTQFTPAFWQLSLPFNVVEHDIVLPKKTTVAHVASARYIDPGQKFRIDFLRFLEEKGDIPLEIFGAQNYHSFTNYKGPVPNDNKEDVILHTKYYFMCENNSEPYYVTEKLWESILCETLCFYWGCPNITELVDKQAFVQLDMTDFEGSYKIVKQAIEEDWWSQRLPFIRNEKKNVLNKYNVFPTIEHIILNNKV